jgi:hypothetical protein
LCVVSASCLKRVLLLQFRLHYCWANKGFHLALLLANFSSSSSHCQFLWPNWFRAVSCVCRGEVLDH